MSEIKELKFICIHPDNSCQRMYYHEATDQYYILQPYLYGYSWMLCTCYLSGNYAEADCSVRKGLQYIIDGQAITIGEGGVITDYLKREEYLNTEYEFYEVKPEYAHLYGDPSYLIHVGMDLCHPEHFEIVRLRWRDICSTPCRKKQSKYKRKFTVTRENTRTNTVYVQGEYNAKVFEFNYYFENALFRFGEGEFLYRNERVMASSLTYDDMDAIKVLWKKHYFNISDGRINL